MISRTSFSISLLLAARAFSAFSSPAKYAAARTFSPTAAAIFCPASPYQPFLPLSFLK